MPNPFAHVELSTDDAKKAKKFYTAVFAWKMSEMPGMNYTMIDVGGGAGGGVQKKPSAEQPTAWLPYVQVDDVKATMAKVLKAGGTAMLEYQEIGDMGSIGVFVDPQGAALGIWAAKAASAPAPEPAPAASSKKGPPVAKQAPPAPSKNGSKKSAPELPPPPPAKKGSVKKAPPAPPPAPSKQASSKKANPAAAKKAPAKKR